MGYSGDDVFYIVSEDPTNRLSKHWRRVVGLLVSQPGSTYRVTITKCMHIQCKVIRIIAMIKVWAELWQFWYLFSSNNVWWHWQTGRNAQSSFWLQSRKGATPCRSAEYLQGGEGRTRRTSLPANLLVKAPELCGERTLQEKTVIRYYPLPPRASAL